MLETGDAGGETEDKAESGCGAENELEYDQNIIRKRRIRNIIDDGSEGIEYGGR